MILTDKNVKKIVFICGALLLIAAFLSSLGKMEGSNPEKTEEDMLAELISQIDGVETVSVAFSMKSGTKNEEIDGIAIVYQGDQGNQTRGKIYELISSLYGIPYSRIYVIG